MMFIMENGGRMFFKDLGCMFLGMERKCTKVCSKMGSKKVMEYTTMKEVDLVTMDSGRTT